MQVSAHKQPRPPGPLPLSGVRGESDEDPVFHPRLVALIAGDGGLEQSFWAAARLHMQEQTDLDLRHLADWLEVELNVLEAEGEGAVCRRGEAAQLVAAKGGADVAANATLDRLTSEEGATYERAARVDALLSAAWREQDRRVEGDPAPSRRWWSAPIHVICRTLGATADLINTLLSWAVVAFALGLTFVNVVAPEAPMQEHRLGVAILMLLCVTAGVIEWASQTPLALPSLHRVRGAR